MPSLHITDADIRIAKKQLKTPLEAPLRRLYPKLSHLQIYTQQANVYWVSGKVLRISYSPELILFLTRFDLGMKVLGDTFKFEETESK